MTGLFDVHQPHPLAFACRVTTAGRWRRLVVCYSIWPTIDSIVTGDRCL